MQRRTAHLCDVLTSEWIVDRTGCSGGRSVAIRKAQKRVRNPLLDPLCGELTKPLLRFAKPRADDLHEVERDLWMPVKELTRAHRPPARRFAAHCLRVSVACRRGLGARVRAGGVRASLPGSDPDRGFTLDGSVCDLPDRIRPHPALTTSGREGGLMEAYV